MLRRVAPMGEPTQEVVDSFERLARATEDEYTHANEAVRRRRKRRARAKSRDRKAGQNG